MARTASIITASTAAILLAATQVAVAAAGLEPGVRVEYAVPPGTSQEDIDRVVSVLRKRLWDLEVNGSVTATGDGIVVSFLTAIAADEAAAFAHRLVIPGDVRFVPVEEGCTGDVEQGVVAPACLTATEPLFDGSGVNDASVGADPQTGEATVELALGREAGDIFDAHAEAHFGELVAVVVDGVVVWAPSINATSFGGQLAVSGDFTEGEAAGLAAAFRSGALPVALELRDVRLEQVESTEVERPTDPPSFRTGGLEWDVYGIAEAIGRFGIDDFVAVLSPEDGIATLTILSDDPSLPGLVTEMLREPWSSEQVTIAYGAGPAAAFLESVPVRPVPLVLGEEVPEQMAWLPEQGAIVGDAASLDAQAAPGQGEVDVELARRRIAEVHAAADEWDKVMQHPDYGGVTIEYDQSFIPDDGLESPEGIPGVLIVGFKGGVPGDVLDRLRAHIDTFAWSSDIETIEGDDVEFTWAELESMKETIEQMAAEHGVEVQTFILYQRTGQYQIGDGGETSDTLGPLDQWISVWPVVDEDFDDERWDEFMAAVSERVPEGALDPSDWLR